MMLKIFCLLYLSNNTKKLLELINISKICHKNFLYFIENYKKDNYMIKK